MPDQDLDLYSPKSITPVFRQPAPLEFTNALEGRVELTQSNPGLEPSLLPIQNFTIGICQQAFENLQGLLGLGYLQKTSGSKRPVRLREFNMIILQ